VTTFFIITKTLGALQSNWELKNKQKNRQKPSARCHRYASGEHKSADQQRRQLSIEIFLLHFGFPYFVLGHTSTQERFAMPESPTSEKGYVLAVPAMYHLRQPKCSKQDGTPNAMGNKAPPARPFCAVRHVSSASVPYRYGQSASRQLGAWAEKTGFCLQNTVYTYILHHTISLLICL